MERKKEGFTLDSFYFFKLKNKLDGKSNNLIPKSSLENWGWREGKVFFLSLKLEKKNCI
jgi:hypothetical protein